MRTTEDLKLAAAILLRNISTSKPYQRVVSSTNVFIAWQTSPTGEFANFLRQNIRNPSAEARFDEIRLGSTSIKLLDESERLREMLDAQSLRDGAVRGLVKKAHFRTLVKRSTAIRPAQMDIEASRSSPRRPTSRKVHPVVHSVRIVSPRVGGEKPSTSTLKVTRVLRGDQNNIIHARKPISKLPDTLQVGRSPAKLALEADQQFTTHMLHFGTDRLLTINNNGDATFGDVRGEDKVTYGVANVSIPHVHKEGALERPSRGIRFWSTPDEDPCKHIVIHRLTPLELSDWCRSTRLQDGEGLLFIHGFNVSFDEAIWRAAQICHDLKFIGVKLCYSWSSRGGIGNYAADESTIEWSQEHLRTFLTEVTTKLGLQRLHIVAHSMGNRALLAVLENWQNQPGATPVSQVVLAAPDIDEGRFKQISRSFGKYEQVTLYASRTDRAILASTKLHKLNRAGNASPPIVIRGLSTVDVTAAGADMFGLGHSYFATSKTVFHDLFYIIKERFTPDRRAGIKISEMGYYELI
ncbi:alpha/beta hydrolase [Pseudomonas syringae]|uniref:alpha/beta hydrolase n=1 Tax=Pseudomonas syringae TaxID=317 RepID=UPI000AEF014B|nr:alpha/beta hydrolase [Pseudomonas syringae]